jgi:glycosyltransferase involved in cell wall biosynthesis
MGRRLAYGNLEASRLTPDISYIVSAYDRPELLPVCLWSIKAQTHQDFEVIVTDNATDKKIAAKHKAIVASMKDARFKYVRTAGKIKVSDCFWSAEYAVKKMARGKWYCFPCDDTYYAPEFAQRMLAAAYAHNWEFVLCGKPVVGPAASGGAGYWIWESPIHRSIKTAFMVKASRFGSFENKPHKSMAANADYAFGMQMQKYGVRCGIVNEPMMFHN